MPKVRFEGLNFPDARQQGRAMVGTTMNSMSTIEDIAKVCHEANRAFCETIGDHSQKSWSDAEPWQRDSAVAGVSYRLNNPHASAAAQHEKWMADKVADGWVYGLVKDPSKKEHPCMVPYKDLPLEQKMKDTLFVAVVVALSQWA